VFLNVGEISADGRRVDETLMVGPLAGPDGREIGTGPVRIVGLLRRRSDGTRFQGEVSGVAELACSRCLDTYSQPLELGFDLVYREAGAPPGAENQETAADLDAAEWMTLDAGRIDLSRLVTEQLYLALPLKPLCEEGCPGLCPACGAPRRDPGCGCAAEVIDARWAALGDLKRRSRG